MWHGLWKQAMCGCHFERLKSLRIRRIEKIEEKNLCDIVLLHQSPCEKYKTKQTKIEKKRGYFNQYINWIQMFWEFHCNRLINHFYFVVVVSSIKELDCPGMVSLAFFRFGLEFRISNCFRSIEMKKIDKVTGFVFAIRLRLIRIGLSFFYNSNCLIK